jgi:N-acetylglucosaminyldiphosphoundecaprenol N-acetyl-beta-D-mannosaminyltransferase
VVGAEDGYFSKEREGEIVARISQAAPDLLFVALATPHQDIWIHNQKTRLGAKIAMGVGGSFDVLSGNLRRSPVWMQRMGAEWLFRLCQEPRRFFRMMGLPLFVWRVMFDSSPLSQKAPSVPSPLR